MKAISHKHRSSGFTAWDLLIVLLTAVLLVGFLPMLPTHRCRVKSARIRCVNNLRQIGLAFRIWADDHGERFPMAVTTVGPGSLEFMGTSEVFRYFQATSNELSNLRTLTCSLDASRRPAINFASLTDANLSYFVGLDITARVPWMILSGDRNITTNGRLMSGILTLTSNSTVSWTKDIHNRCGNLGLADGSAQQLGDAALQRQITFNVTLPARLAIP